MFCVFAAKRSNESFAKRTRQKISGRFNFDIYFCLGLFGWFTFCVDSTDIHDSGSSQSFLARQLAMTSLQCSLLAASSTHFKPAADEVF